MGAPGNFSVLNNRTRINYRACSLLVLLGQLSIFTSAIPRRPRDAVLFVAPKGLSSSSISFTSISASYHRRHQRLHAKRKRFLSDDFLDLGDDRFPLLDPYKYTFDPSTLNRALRTTTLTTSQKFLGLLATAALIGAIAISPDLADPEKVWNFPFFGVTDSALPTLSSTSLPCGLMLLSPFVLATATLQATSKCLKTVHS